MTPTKISLVGVISTKHLKADSIAAPNMLIITIIGFAEYTIPIAHRPSLYEYLSLDNPDTSLAEQNGESHIWRPPFFSDRLFEAA